MRLFDRICCVQFFVCWPCSDLATTGVVFSLVHLASLFQFIFLFGLVILAHITTLLVAFHGRHLRFPPTEMDVHVVHHRLFVQLIFATLLRYVQPSLFGISFVTMFALRTSATTTPNQFVVLLNRSFGLAFGASLMCLFQNVFQLRFSYISSMR